MLEPKEIDWLNGYKNKAYIYAVYKRPTSDLGHIQTQSEGMEKDIPCKWKSKESWSSNTISDKIDFKIKNVTRDKEDCYIMIKESV